MSILETLVRSVEMLKDGISDLGQVAVKATESAKGFNTAMLADAEVQRQIAIEEAWLIAHAPKGGTGVIASAAAHGTLLTGGTMKALNLLQIGPGEILKVRAAFEAEEDAAAERPAESSRRIVRLRD